MTRMTVGQVGEWARSQGLIFSRPDYPLFKLRHREPEAQGDDGAQVWVFERLDEVIAVLETFGPPPFPQPAPAIQRPAASSVGACRDLTLRDKRAPADY